MAMLQNFKIIIFIICESLPSIVVLFCTFMHVGSIDPMCMGHIYDPPYSYIWIHIYVVVYRHNDTTDNRQLYFSIDSSWLFYFYCLCTTGCCHVSTADRRVVYIFNLIIFRTVIGDNDFSIWWLGFESLLHHLSRNTIFSNHCDLYKYFLYKGLISYFILSIV